MTPETKNMQTLREALIEIKRQAESSRIWSGQGWHYNPLAPFKAQRIVELAERALDNTTQQAEPALEMPWRCFHCDEVFTDAEQARLHFGAERDFADPACQINIAEYRAMEARMRSYNDEDAEIHRAMYAMQSKHRQDLIREEEKGYARGLDDGMKLAPPAQQEAAGLSDADRNYLFALMRRLRSDEEQQNPHFWTVAHEAAEAIERLIKNASIPSPAPQVTAQEAAAPAVPSEREAVQEMLRELDQKEETIYRCSNPACGVEHTSDPRGHCPVCIAPTGAGWSCYPDKPDPNAKFPPLPAPMVTTYNQSGVRDGDYYTAWAVRRYAYQAVLRAALASPAPNVEDVFALATKYNIRCNRQELLDFARSISRTATPEGTEGFSGHIVGGQMENEAYAIEVLIRGDLPVELRTIGTPVSIAATPSADKQGEQG